jgi:ATP-binding cassette, subfamily B, bacterial MsbA
LTDFLLLKKYFGPYRNQLIVITIFSIICGFVQAVSLGTLVPVINIIATNQEPTGNLWNIFKSALNFFNIELNLTTLLIILSFIFVCGQILIFTRQSLQVNLRFGFVQDTKEKLFGQLLHADLAYHNNKKAGQFLDTILIETERAGSGLFVITDIFSNVCLVAVYILMLVYISVQMTICSIIIVVVMLLFVNKLLEISRIYGIKCVESNTEINEYSNERLNLLKLIKSNSSEDREMTIFSKIADDFRFINTKFAINGAKIELLFQSIMFIVAVVIVYLSMITFHLSVGLILVFLFVLVMLTAPLRSINNQRHELSGMMASLGKVDTTLEESRRDTHVFDGDTTFSGFKSGISLNNVAYEYIPGKPVLEGINISIRKDDMIAFVGPSGGGKSTLVDLLMRLIDPTAGFITIDGVDLKKFTLKSYHAKIGLVSQDIFLFNDSVLNNICYGSDVISLEKARNAARIAYADEFIESLPEGYSTSLGDRGVKLSGGQKQRIALARAIYKNPDILILDEATSALDTESEKIIQNSISRIKHKYTILIVAHRLSTIQDADTIVVIENGKIVERGSHEELLSINGTYARYHTMQQGKEGEINSDDRS